jgi:hypothetical protein
MGGYMDIAGLLMGAVLTGSVIAVCGFVSGYYLKCIDSKRNIKEKLREERKRIRYKLVGEFLSVERVS